MVTASPARLPRVLATRMAPERVEPPAPAEGPSSGPRIVALRPPPQDPIEAVVDRALSALVAMRERGEMAIVRYAGRPCAPEDEERPDFGELAGGRGRDRA